MKKVAILYSTYTPTVDALKSVFKNADVDCFMSAPTKEDSAKYDLIIVTNYKEPIESNALNIHHSLLPSFAGDEPEREAIIEGVKVTGITIYYTNPQKIVAQYPLFIQNDTHYDELVEKLNQLEQLIYPIVAGKILNNEQFDIKTLLQGNSKSCCGNCQSCGGH